VIRLLLVLIVLLEMVLLVLLMLLQFVLLPLPVPLPSVRLLHVQVVKGDEIKLLPGQAEWFLHRDVGLLRHVVACYCNNPSPISLVWDSLGSSTM
jgi:hypothetical protein